MSSESMLNVHPASTRQHLLKGKKSLYDSFLKTIFAVNMLKLKIMKRTGFLLFIASICCILFASCSDDNEMPENYVFSHIDFLKRKGMAPGNSRKNYLPTLLKIEQKVR